MNRTPLYSFHVSLGARMVDFAGLEMPVQYSGIIAEHTAVRARAGLFDISHMGQVWIYGPGSGEFLQALLTNDVRLAAPGKGIYSHMCKENGGVVDDVFLYCIERERYLLIVNAARRQADHAWIKAHSKGPVEIMEAPQAAAFALQGPSSAAILQRFSSDAAQLPRRGVAETVLGGTSAVIARTGYTGEDGFEFFGPAGHIVILWEALFESAKNEGLLPCGLGARDTLRLEMGYMLYGHDIDEDHNPLEAGLDWVVKFDKGDFIGREALVRQKKEGLGRKLLGIRLLEPGVPRAGQEVCSEGKRLGVLTSGTYSPSLKAGIGLTYLPPAFAPEGTPCEVSSGLKRFRARTAAPPFYRNDSKKEEQARAKAL